jgi:hypothetical protein
MWGGPPVKQKKILLEKCSSPVKGKKKCDEVARKIEPLSGYLLAQRVKCGRANCKCAEGFLHGPYYYRVWNEDGKRFKEYVRKADLPSVIAGIEARHQQEAEIRASNEEARAIWELIKSENQQLKAWLKSHGVKL